MVEINFLMTASLLMVSSCPAQERPNIVLIPVDDMGYSNIGCYGGGAPAPNIGALAPRGIRFTQLYNTSRSCPARANLMTGLYRHQADIGRMSKGPFANPDQKSPNGWGARGYKGYLNRNYVITVEVSKEDGYHTYMAGKWYLGMHGEEEWPSWRGFKHFYNALSGACSCLRPLGGRGLTLDNTKLPAPDTPYYATDIFASYAIQFVNEQKDDRSSFLYSTFSTPHWPLYVEEKDIQKFTKMYRGKGQDEIWGAQHKRMAKMGTTDPNTDFAEWENREWNELIEQEKDRVAYRMVIYMTQVYCVDYNIGKLIGCSKKNHKMGSTLILFMFDNGAYAEPYEELGGGKVEEANNPASSSVPTCSRAWAQVSNTPFRKYKCRTYEGGISTPLILSWEGALGNKKGRWYRIPGYLPDIMPTILEATEAKCLETYHGGNKVYPSVGSSLFPAVHRRTDSLHEYIYQECQNNRVVRWRDQKAIRDKRGKEWKLHDVAKDWTERFNVAEQRPEVLTRLVTEWERWAHTDFVLPKHPKK